VGEGHMAGPPDLRINADEGESHRIRIARILVSRDFPYLSAPLYLAVLVETPEVETAQINERLHLLFNPKWTRTLDDRELKGLLLHEIYHWLRGHTGARGQEAYSLVRAELPGVEEGLAWNLVNLAADLEINDDIPHQGSRYALPRGGVLPENLGLEPGGILEAYIKELLKRLEGEAGPDEDGKGIEAVGNNQAGEGNEEGECSEKGEGGRNREAEGAEPNGGGLRDRLKAPSFPIDLRPAPEVVARRLEKEGLGLKPGLSEAIRQQVAVEIMRHVATRGDVPANLRRWAKERLHPKVNWRAVLRNSVRQGLVTLRQRRFPSYALRHRRAEALDPFFLPGAYGRLPRVAVVVDTSGSVSDAMLAQALGELKGVLRSGARVTLYSVDAEVHHVQRVFRGDPVVLYGGGGTDMRVGIARALEDGHDLVVVLTDGYTPWPEVPPRARVVVGLLGDCPNKPPPWAKVVRIPLNAE
jgi:predicted metal-dependent peptidase